MLEGRLALKSSYILRRFREAGGKFVWEDLNNREIQKANVTWDGESKPVSFSVKDATDCGYLPAPGKSNWNKDRPAQLRARLITRTIRAIAPELLEGGYSTEEMEDVLRDETKIEAKPEPKPEIKAPEGHIQPTLLAPVVEEPFVWDSVVKESLSANADAVEAYMMKKNWITVGQTWEDCPVKMLNKIHKELNAFLKVCGVEVSNG
jgi:hypothetical protein